MITVFASLWTADGVFSHVSPTALFAALAKPRAYESKNAPKRWMAWRTNGGRKLIDLIECFAIVLDVDKSPVALSVLTAALADVWSFVYSTWSATESCPRWRIVVPLDRPCTLAEYPRVWRAVAELVEPVAAPDYAAKDGSHVWSAPAMKPDGWFECAETEGEVFSVGAALERFPEPTKAAAPAELPSIHSASRYARGALMRTAETVASSQRGERNRVLNAQAFPVGRFVATGELDEEEVITVLSEAAISAGMPVREARYTARRSIRERLRRAG